jgi:hypothetical protein
LHTKRIFEKLCKKNKTNCSWYLSGHGENEEDLTTDRPTDHNEETSDIAYTTDTIENFGSNLCHRETQRLATYVMR